MKKILILLIATLIASPSYAAVASGPDVTTRPDSYYSTNADAVDSVAILPPPPAFDSIEFLIDRAKYEEGLLERNTERGKLAVLDAQSGKVAESFSSVFVIEINATPPPGALYPDQSSAQRAGGHGHTFRKAEIPPCPPLRFVQYRHLLSEGRGAPAQQRLLPFRPQRQGLGHGPDSF